MNPEFFILVRSIPNKNNQIWENLVDVNKILRALSWLKVHNHLYANINLPSSSESLQQLISQLPSNEFSENKTAIINNEISNKDSDSEKSNTNNIKKNKDLNIEEEHDGFLTQTSQSANFYRNFTIYPMYDNRINETATSLYQQVKVFDIALNKATNFLDAMCFPLLFPKGLNCQNSERPMVRLRDCDFLKAKYYVQIQGIV